MTEYNGALDFCESCGANIWWARNPKTGKRSPMNAKPHPGLFTIETDDGETEPTVVALAGKAYTSHFSSCPQAAKWRKP